MGLVKTGVLGAVVSLFLCGFAPTVLGQDAEPQAQNSTGQISNSIDTGLDTGIAARIEAAAGETTIIAAPSSPEAVTALEERPPRISTELFAGRSPIAGAKLSPDGAQMAFNLKRDGESYIAIADAATRAGVGSFRLPSEMDLSWFRWAGTDKIMFSLSVPGKFMGQDMRFSRLFVYHLTEGWLTVLAAKKPVVDGDNVIYVSDDGSEALVAMQRDIYSWPSVYRFALVEDAQAETVENPKDGVWNWYADETGVVRAGIGWRARRMRVYYREKEGDRLKLIAKLKEGDDETEYWDVAQILNGSNQGYILRKGESGRVGLYLFDYAQREVIEQIYEHPEWDIDSASIRDGKPFAAYYTDDRERVVWFDDEQRETYDLLGKSLPEDEVWVTSRAEDSSRMIVWAGGEADPGALYIYTPAAHTLDLFGDMRPGLDFQLLSKPAPIEYTARDGTTIAGYLTLPRGRLASDLPLIVMPHGGPYGIRDGLNYNDEVQFLANRGYAVIQPNYRGSGGYGEDFYELGRGQVGRAMQDDLDDAMDWAVAQGVADPDRVCVVGGSYGGYAALWAVIRNPERYRCAASWAGVTDWDKMLSYDRGFMTRKGGRKWTTLVEGEDDLDLDEVSPYRLADQLTRPVLLAHGTDDSNVPFSQFKRFRKAAGKAAVRPTELVIEDEGHSFSSSENEQQWLDALDAFLAEHNPAD